VWAVHGLCGALICGTATTSGGELITWLQQVAGHCGTPVATGANSSTMQAPAPHAARGGGHSTTQRGGRREWPRQPVSLQRAKESTACCRLTRSRWRMQCGVRGTSSLARGCLHVAAGRVGGSGAARIGPR
jgi:hypothetical protein